MVPPPTPAGRALRHSLERAGFYPRLVADAIDDTLDGGEPLGHMVHVETHIEHNEVHRHVTALVLTADALVVVHVDDQQLEEFGQQATAQVSTETVPLARIDSVVVGAVYGQPQDYKPSDSVRELTLGIAWSGGQRLDLTPAECADPSCDADHGYTGTTQREDILLRISAGADGVQAVDDAREFARALRRLVNAATQPPRPSGEPRGVRGPARFVRGHHSS